MRKGAKQFEEMWSIINEENKDSLYTDLKPCNSVNFLQRRTRELKLSNEIKDLCEEVCSYVEKEDYLIKHVPLSRTAGCIYFTCEFLKVSIGIILCNCPVALVLKVESAFMATLTPLKDLK